MEVIYHKHVAEYLNELVEVLYDKEYFGFKESAYDYVDWIFEQIESSINRKVKKPAPKYFDRYGHELSYVIYKRNILVRFLPKAGRYISIFLYW